MEELALGVGDKIEVYKANMIIPQIASNLTRSGVRDIPTECPVCHGKTEIRQISDTKALYCTNEECQAKHVKAFTLFVSRDALNIEGLSESTLEKFISRGFIKEFADIFHLECYKEEIQSMEGFGEKSYQNLIASAEKARTTTLPKVIYALGIAGIGLANAKVICREFGNDIEKMKKATEEELNNISGIGQVLAKAYVDYFSDSLNVEKLERLLKELVIPEEKAETAEQIFKGVNFVITGSVNHFANRNAVKELIESLGGKVTGSVTSKTNYLINNDVTSTSSKNKKANELGVPIISEETFLEMVNGN
jgi:DNA ligase (NAD+)